MLGNTHAPRGDNPLAVRVDSAEVIDVLSGNAGRGLDERPALMTEVFCELFETERMFLDEVEIEQTLRAVLHCLVVQFNDVLGDAFDQCKVATQFRLDKSRCDLRAAHGDHFQRVLRACEAFETTLTEWVD